MTSVVDPIVIWHGNCSDGAAAAWVVNKYHKETKRNVRFVEGVHGTPPEDFKNETIYLVDFSYKRPIIERLLANGNKIIILDHHESAVTELQELLENGSIDGVLDMNHSGCVVAWMYFFPGKEVPEKLLLLEDADLWKWRLPKSKSFGAGITAKLKGPIQPFDIELVGTYGWQIVDVCLAGNFILNYREKIINEAIDNACDINFCGWRVKMTNSPYSIGSEVAGKLAETVPFGVYYNQDSDGGFKLGLRSTDGGVNVAKLCELFGGGGHPTAAGCKLNVEQFYQLFQG